MRSTAAQWNRTAISRMRCWGCTPSAGAWARHPGAPARSGVVEFSHRGIAENGQSSLALDLFQRCLWLSSRSLHFLAALKACCALGSKEESTAAMGKARSLEIVMALHREASRFGCADDVLVATSLIDAYEKSGSMEDAQRAFDRVPHRNVVSWTALIAGHAPNRDGAAGLQIFQRMDPCCTPNSHTFVAALELLLEHRREGRRRSWEDYDQGGGSRDCYGDPFSSS
ncbi:pentatricopeptide repeat-containing protein At3g26782, mitochondrial-like [Selaginella moellendorffii]|uniref:pentatricopeptide repeat-containing protein At3g26782, mitochondrial-like n=1 Tax=Selaginella moellendorffii TaxID=88036 RepID=UPI000D1D0CF0|nr:pentatricopeptide repeat-containing protein At3g26782, mitochondrial-like [Selaginella moellendorffii]|eukprot:XP_024533660.1 pentatricopeptide repeat-containing protein At3g26782, mitochondrial-like [Selaginella moellendorffii]